MKGRPSIEFDAMKWIWVILLVIIGVFFTYMAATYLTVSLGHLPHWFPGHKIPTPHHHKLRGHYRKGGAATALLAIIAFVAAAWIAFRKPKQGASAATTTPAAGTADASGTSVA
jgi:hypothetical protein